MAGPDEPLPESVVDDFAQYDPSQQDIEEVMEKTRSLWKDRSLGEPVPFADKDLKDYYVVLTPSKKWRILFRRTNPEGDPEIKNISPEE